MFHCARLSRLCSTSAIILGLLASGAMGADKREEVAAVLFDSSRLLDVRLEMPEADWKALAAQRREFAASFLKTAPINPYTYFRADLTINGVRLPSVGVRKKGFFGSMDQSRPSLKIKFNEFKKNGKLGGLDRLTLNNNKQDQAHISQLLAYETFRKVGLPAPRYSLAKLTVNGRSLGVYGHVESIKKPFLKRQFGSDTGDMFEGVFPTDFYADRLGRFEVKNNKKNAKDRADLRKISAILANPGEDLVERLGEHFDVDEFIRHWATEVMIGFWDGYAGNQNNYYLYRDPADSKFHFIPWGADFTFTSQFQRGPKSIKAKGLMAFHLYQIPAIRAKYRTQLMQLLETAWNEKHLLSEVDRIAALVRGHLHEDQQGFERAVEGARAFIENRRAEIMDEIKEGPVPFNTPSGSPMYYKEVGSVAGAFTATWSASADKDTLRLGQTTLKLVLDGKPVQLARQGVTAEPGRSRGGFGGRPGPPGPPPPTLAFALQRLGNEQSVMNLSLRFGSEQFQAAAKAIDVQGTLSEGSGGGFGFGAGRTFIGKVTLKSAARKEGHKVTGELNGKLYQMQGGFGGGTRRQAPPVKLRKFLSVQQLQSLDRNKDGRITEAETPKSLRKLVFGRLDANKNKVIDNEELSQFVKSQQEKPATDDK